MDPLRTNEQSVSVVVFSEGGIYPEFARSGTKSCPLGK